MYFLETLQVRAPSHGGVLYSFDIDEMLFEFFMNLIFFFSIFHVFIVCFMLFPTLKTFGVEKKNSGGGGGGC